MKSSRKGFAFLEFVLVIVIIGLLAAVFIPASLAIKEKARVDVITNQLSELTKKAQAYINEKDLKSVDYKTLINAKVIEPLESVAGEKYEQVVVKKEGGTVSVKTASGTEVSREY